MGWRETISALLGISAYQAPPSDLPSLDDADVRKRREKIGGQLSPMPVTKTRWYLADLESAMFAADAGDLSRAAQLCRSMRRDGVLAGLLSTCTGGLVRLPKRFSGNEEICRDLEGRDGVRSKFDHMFPPSELAMFEADGELLGVAVAERVPVPGSDPVFTRLDPEYLRYRWNENRWYYVSVIGQIPITPGDGRWILYTPGGRIAPWQNGLWHALGRAWINKEHALLHRANWEAKLANPARAAYSPAAATETQKQGFLSNIIAWGVNTVFDLPPGWEVKLIESNGRGWESFTKTIEWAEREYMIGLAGQVVTVTGGTGFSNADVHKSIRADLIEARADSLAFCLNTQGIPAYVVEHYGSDALDETACIEWDTTPPRDLAAEATALAQAATAITGLTTALQPYKRVLDLEELAHRFSIPLLADEDQDGVADEDEGGALVEGLDDAVKDEEVSLQ
jgi:hypothetical protein